MRKGIIVFIGVLLTMVVSQSAWAQKEKYHSIFIYNFSKYVKWPDSKVGEGDFIIGVYGKSSITKDLKIMASAKKASGQTIRVQEFNSVKDLNACHILYISSEESGNIDQIIKATQDQPILIVTDKPGLAQKGSVINFIEVGGKIKFELNQQNADVRGLKVSGSLATLAIVV